MIERWNFAVTWRSSKIWQLFYIIRIVLEMISKASWIPLVLNAFYLQMDLTQLTYPLLNYVTYLWCVSTIISMHDKYGRQHDIIVSNTWLLPWTHKWSRMHLEKDKSKIHSCWMIIKRWLDQISNGVWRINNKSLWLLH